MFTVRSIISPRERPLLYVAGAAVVAGSVYYLYRWRNQRRRSREDAEVLLAVNKEIQAPLQSPTVPTSQLPPPPPRPSCSHSAPETTGDTISPQSPPTSHPPTPPLDISPPQRAPELPPDCPSQSALEAIGDTTSPQSPPTPRVQAPPVAPPSSQPPTKPQALTVCSVQSAPEVIGDITSPQSQPTPRPPTPPLPQPAAELLPVCSSLCTPEDTGDTTSSQSQLTPGPPTPPVENSPPQRAPELLPVCSVQSAPEAIGDTTSPQNPFTSLPPPPTPLTVSPPQRAPELPLGCSVQSAPEAPPLVPSPPQPALQPLPHPPPSDQSTAEAPPLVPSPPQPALQPLPHPPLSDQSPAEVAGLPTVSPEAHQVPTLYNYFTNKSISNFALRLSALRQAFTLVLNNSHHLKFISIAGRVILGGLATRNGRELPVFQQAYNHLIEFAQDASHQEAICTELAEVGIQHFNLIDVLFELVLMGVLQGARPLISPTPGGFLELLINVILSFAPVNTESRPRAEQYLFLIQDEAMLLLDDIFGKEERLYMDPGALALTLWDCLEKHVHQLLQRLNGT